MRSMYKIFRSTSGLEDVLFRASEFITRVGRDNLIAVNTFVDPSEATVSRAGMASASGMLLGQRSIGRGVYPEEMIVVVWYWEPTGQ